MEQKTKICNFVNAGINEINVIFFQISNNIFIFLDVQFN